jgi:hypothetical protein
MEIKITGEDISNTMNNISRIASKPVKLIDAQKFKLAYRIKRIFDKLQSSFADVDKKRIELIKKYGAEDKEKSNWNVKPENMDIFHKELKILLSSPVSLDIELIPMDLLVNSGIDISLMELAAIEQFVDKSKEA